MKFILDHTFVEMEVLKPIYAATALLGIHILNETLPFFVNGIQNQLFHTVKSFPPVVPGTVNSCPISNTNKETVFPLCEQWVIHKNCT